MNWSVKFCIGKIFPFAYETSEFQVTIMFLMLCCRINRIHFLSSSSIKEEGCCELLFEEKQQMKRSGGKRSSPPPRSEKTSSGEDKEWKTKDFNANEKSKFSKSSCIRRNKVPQVFKGV